MTKQKPEIDKLIESFNEKIRDRNLRVTYFLMPDNDPYVCYGLHKDLRGGILDIYLNLELMLEPEFVETNPWLRQIPSLGRIESMMRKKYHLPKRDVKGDLHVEIMPDEGAVNLLESEVLRVHFVDNKIRGFSYGELNSVARTYEQEINDLKAGGSARKAIDLIFRIYDEIDSAEGRK